MALCRAGQFKCGDGRCVNATVICDGKYDCVDAADERDCDICDSDEWRCEGGTCIAKSSRCDGNRDCSDGTDELDCPCRGDQFACGDGTCLEKWRKCDGYQDCRDRSDEQNCPKCRSDQFICGDGTCIDSRRKCDSYQDCRDGSDERDCGCRSDQFDCGDKTCIESQRKCDGYRDCRGGEDELDCECRSDQFDCKDGNCLEKWRKCDGSRDCRDGLDEMNCGCRSDQFDCRDGTCLEKWRKCDGSQDCRDGSDEFECGCRSDQFDCRDGTCIEAWRECDGRYDCRDRLDETGCPQPTKPPVACLPDRVLTTRLQRQSWSMGVRPEDFVCYISYGTYEEMVYQHQLSYQETTEIEARQKRGADTQQWNYYSAVGCRDYEFTCGDGTCIESWQKCDGRTDCGDRSDEDVRECGRCLLGEFKCSSGDQCIPERFRCDGSVNCRDRSDEVCDFVPKGELNLRTYPTKQDIKEDREVVFQCRDEGTLRANVEWRRGNGMPLPQGSRDMEGRLEMPNIKVSHSGTYICSAVGYPTNTPGAEVSVYLNVSKWAVPTSRPLGACRVDQATCASGECIAKSQVCDGDIDCADRSDETRCRQGGVCEPNEFQCDNKRCVLKTWRCDSDDDCGDNSDERDCGTLPPGSPCRYYEWQCGSRDQCIPKSFQCDGENDCQDLTDEAGCREPIIVVSPPPMVVVDQTYTLVINCTAMGVPTPEVVWRLNWGHVPDKCTMTSTPTEGNKAYGELTCPNLVESDQGAYSCEAINSKGSCFAGSAGCGQPGQDAIVVVNGDDKVCGSSSFNSLAIFEQDCMRCHCSGVATQCSSADLYKTVLPAPRGSFSLWGVDTTVNSGRSSQLGSELLRSTAGGGQKVYLSLEAAQASAGTPYFSLPDSHTGNQLNSYGGYLRFTTKFRGEGRPISGPMVILKGKTAFLREGRDSIYASSSKPLVQGGTEIEVRFWPGSWYKTIGRGGELQDPASREEIMDALADLDMLLIRAQHIDSGTVDTTVEDIRMDSAAVNGRERTGFVEQCICPAGYMGLSCQECAPGYNRERQGDRYVCQRPPEPCQRGYFTDPERGMQCSVCPCPGTTPSNQFARECFLDNDQQVTCKCPTGYQGRRCGDCAPGYVGNPNIPGDRCRPGPRCNYPEGSESREADRRTGLCICRSGWRGPECNERDVVPTARPDPLGPTGRCEAYQFFSSEQSVPGCINCFCMGIPTGARKTQCHASNLYREQTRAVFQDDQLGFSLVNSAWEPEISSQELILNEDSRELSYDGFSDLSNPIFWSLPSQFLGNKVSSYGGYLEFTLRHVSVPDGAPAAHTEFLVELEGNDIRLIHKTNDVPRDNEPHTYRVLFQEKEWVRSDNQQSNREHMLMALADIQFIVIRATHSPQTREAAISDVIMNTGVDRNTGNQLATAVEECSCPTGYKGLSCEDCSVGFTRDNSGLYLGLCHACDCNGKSNSCDAETGECLECRDFTTGPNCRDCLPGYTRSGNQCLPDGGQDPASSCDPKGTVTDAWGSGSADYDYDNECSCKENVEGRNCDRCKVGTFHLSEMNDLGCSTCFCSGVTDECSDGRLFWSTLRMPIFNENHGIRLMDKDRRVVKQPEELTFLRQSYELSYRAGTGDSTVYYWALPQQFTGNKVTAYGGNMTITQRYEKSGWRDKPIAAADIVMMGNGVTLVLNKATDWAAGTSMLYRVPMYEDGWTMESTGEEATREEFLKAITNIEAILVRASLDESMGETVLKKVMMDIAVPQVTGGPLAQGIEECRCPAGYKGFSCGECTRGFYRDLSNRCTQCPCNNNEQSCSAGRVPGEVQCLCKEGFSGHDCGTRAGTEPWPPVTRPPSRPPISITIQGPKIQVVQPGETIRFNCNARPTFQTSDPTTYEWTREYGRLPSSASDDGNGLLVITRVRTEDSGTYICTARVAQYVTTDRAVLTVGGGANQAPSVTINPQYKQASTGDYVEFMCEADGYPQPSIAWTRMRGQAMSRQAVIHGGQLIIQSASSQDQGQYVCTATNSEGSNNAMTQLYVSGESRPPVPPPDSGPFPGLMVEPQDVTSSRDEEVRLVCRVDGSGYTMRWSKRDGRLPYTATDNNGVLIISRAKAEDTGIYVCIVTSPSGTVQETQARVTILTHRGPPTVRIEPEDQTIGQGSTATLQCTAAGDPAPTVVWSKVGEQQFSSPNVMVVGNTLTVRNAAVDDRGMYICTAQNAGGSARASAIVEVERREPPSIEIYPDVAQTVTVGGSVLFQCRALTGIPTPRISWSRVDGRAINQDMIIRDVIRINQVTSQHAGQYKCKAENDAGSTEGIATLTTQEMPTVTMNPAGSVTVQLGKPLNIQCNVQGDPRPTIRWQQLGVEREDPGLRGHTAATYSIRSATKQNEGTYACIATNAAGEMEDRLQVIVTDDSNPYPVDPYPVDPYPVDPYPVDPYPVDPYPNQGRENLFEAKLGGNAELQCYVVGNVGNVATRWRRKDGRPLPPRHSQSGNLLYLVGVDRNDATVYTCEGTDSSGRSIFQADTTVTVTDPPRVTLDPQRQTVQPGDNPQITCTATGDVPIRIEWTREGGQLSRYATQDNQGNRNYRTLQFRNISPNDAGRYICKATNAAGVAESVADVIVNDRGNGGRRPREEAVCGSDNMVYASERDAQYQRVPVQCRDFDVHGFGRFCQCRRHSVRPQHGDGNGGPRPGPGNGHQGVGNEPVCGIDNRVYISGQDAYARGIQVLCSPFTSLDDRTCTCDHQGLTEDDIDGAVGEGWTWDQESIAGLPPPVAGADSSKCCEECQKTQPTTEIWEFNALLGFCNCYKTTAGKRPSSIRGQSHLTNGICDGHGSGGHGAGGDSRDHGAGGDPRGHGAGGDPRGHGAGGDPRGDGAGGAVMGHEVRPDGQQLPVCGEDSNVYVSEAAAQANMVGVQCNFPFVVQDGGRTCQCPQSGGEWIVVEPDANGDFSPPPGFEFVDIGPHNIEEYALKIVHLIATDPSLPNKVMQGTAKIARPEGDGSGGGGEGPELGGPEMGDGHSNVFVCGADNKVYANSEDASIARVGVGCVSDFDTSDGQTCQCRGQRREHGPDPMYGAPEHGPDPMQNREDKGYTPPRQNQNQQNQWPQGPSGAAVDYMNQGPEGYGQPGAQGGYGQQGDSGVADNVLQFESADGDDDYDYSLVVKSPEDGPVGPRARAQNYPPVVSYGSPDVGLYDGPSSTAVTGTVGATVELPCPLPEADDTTWQKDGGEIPATAFHLRGKLRIPYVTEADASSYTCSSGGKDAIVVLTVEQFSCTMDEFKCSNNDECIRLDFHCDGEIDCTDGSDEVNCRYKREAVYSHSPPEIKIKPSNVGGAYQGEFIDVRCLVTGAPKSSTISWSKVDGSLASNVKTTKHLLRFDALIQENGGKYRCTVETPGGTYTEDYDLIVKG